LATHISCAEPYCPDLRKAAFKAAEELKLSYHKTGTAVVINGPRFSTKSESRWFSAQNWEVINMTQYPEVVLARELEMCYLNISLITDYDCGLEGEVAPSSAQEILKVFEQNLHNLKNLLFKIIKNLPEQGNCICSNAIETGRFI